MPMDIDGVKATLGKAAITFGHKVQEKLPEPWSTYEITVNIMISVCIGALAMFLIMYYVWFWKLKEPVLKIVKPDPNQPRFRRRDKVIFYGRKMLRRVRSFAKNSIPNAATRRSKKSKIVVMKLAKKLLQQFHKESQPQLKKREPPPSYLEVDWFEGEPIEHRLPAEVMYMLRSVRVLGHFEKPIFLELCRFMESRFVPAGSFLFKIGDLDDSIYVVQSGKVNVFITEPDGTDHMVKEVNKGESIHSLLSILDVLTDINNQGQGNASAYKTVTAVALTDSTILRLPAKAFQIVLERYPESLVRVVQIIMVRLQRVTFMALHNYLGLTYELINPENQSDKTFSIHSILSSPKGSPTKLIPPAPSIISAADSERVLKVTNMDEDVVSSEGSKVAMEIPRRKPSIRRSSEPGAGKLSSSDLEGEPSDFDVAMVRARVGRSLEDDPISTGSPPVKPGLEELYSQGTPTRRSAPKKAVVTDNVSIINDERPSISDEDLMELALQDIVRLFGLEDESLLLGHCCLRHIKHSVTLNKQGDQDANLFFVVTGQLCVQQQVQAPTTTERTLYVVHPGEIVGSLAVLTGEPSFFTIRSITDSCVVYISKNDFYAIMKEQPKIVLNVGRTVVKRMSSFVRQIDFALDWMLIEAGRALFRQGEHSDCIYIILNGRLRSVVTLVSGKKELVGEYGRGELVGIVEVLTQTERATTMMAVRDTELAQIPDELLNLIKRKFPQIVTRLIHLLGHRILGNLHNRTNITSVLSEHPNMEPRPTVANLATVAIVPVSEDVPLTNFTMELQHALLPIGMTLRLTSDIIQSKLGVAALDSVNEYRLSSWLGQQEDIHRMVLYQCDKRMTPWTQRCIRQADCILIVALASQEPRVGQIEKQMETLAVRAQKELILLHAEDSPTPTKTVEWLNLRDWCSSHHHLRCSKRVFSRRPHSKQLEMYRRLFETEPDRLSDFSRVARFLTGTAIGLVLGGGGARGSAHVGMIRAMNEAGIPIDMIGGTSIGSLMGALWAEERNITRYTQRAREWSLDMNSLWKKIFDLTYPTTAMFSGASFNHSIETVFRERQIEDLWIPYFCITTDITSSKMRVHTNGSLWRYVRASMSLSGYLPPLCDPVDGHLLLDGGYVNNLPADVMKAMGAQNIFAVDVGAQDEADLTNYGDALSGWWILWKKYNPWTTKVKVPNMHEIQSRLAYVNSVRQLEAVKSSNYCEYIRPPIDKYRTLQFGSFDEIHDAGFNHGKTMFSMLEKQNYLDTLFREKSTERIKADVEKTLVPVEANFTDLAELISRIDDNPRSRDTQFYISDGNTDDEFDEDEEKISVISEPGPRGMDYMSHNRRRHGRAGSEGATPGSTPSDEWQEPMEFQRDVDEDLDDLDEDDPSEEDDLALLDRPPPGSPPRIIPPKKR